MPVFDFDEATIETFGVLVDYDGGGVVTTVPDIDLVYLHGSETSALYHAEGTTGESTPVDVTHNLVDEQGNLVVDDSSNQIVVILSEDAILFHAKETDTLFHAEA